MVGQSMQLTNPLQGSPLLAGYNPGKAVNTPDWYAPITKSSNSAPVGNSATAGLSTRGLPRQYEPTADTPKGIQQNSRAYWVNPPMNRGHVDPSLDDSIAGGPRSFATPKAGIPTFFPFGIRAIADWVGGLGPGNAGQITAVVVPPDRYWRARTTPVKASNTLRLPGQTALRTSPGFGIPGLSFGS